MERVFDLIFLTFSTAVLLSCNSVNSMYIATFMQPIKDSENLDVNTKITIPDQSLSVREILQRFTRGTIDIPDIETGYDDDIDSGLNDFEDFVDANDTIGSANRYIMNEKLKNEGAGAKEDDGTQRSEVKEDSVAEGSEL